VEEVEEEVGEVEEVEEVEVEVAEVAAEEVELQSDEAAGEGGAADDPVEPTNCGKSQSSKLKRLMVEGFFEGEAYISLFVLFQ
jgi:hypothetical protein